MTTNTQHRRLGGWLLLAAGTLGLLMTLTFRTQAQTSSSPKKGKQGATAPRSQSDAKGGTMEMDGISKAELEKAQLELERAQSEMAKQDWKKVEAEMANAKLELESAMKTAQVAFEKEAMEKAMVEMEKSLAKNKGQFENEMKKAQVEMKKAQQQLALMQKGMELMEKDGLIKPGESINIDWEDDILIINGQKQSKEVSDKYRKYFKHEKHHNTGKNATVI